MHSTLFWFYGFDCKKEQHPVFLLPTTTKRPVLAVQQPFPHESLLMDRKELRLSRDEKRAAKKGYEEEKRASVPYTRPSYAHYYPASDQSLTNIPAFSQRNWSVIPFLVPVLATLVHTICASCASCTRVLLTRISPAVPSRSTQSAYGLAFVLLFIFLLNNKKIKKNQAD